MPEPMKKQERDAMLAGIFGEVLARALLGDTLVGVEPGSGTPLLQPSPMKVLAYQVWQGHSTALMARFVEAVDLEQVAEQIAGNVAAEWLRPGTSWSSNPHAEALRKRVLEIVAQQLGQRVVDQMDLTLGPKEVTGG